ncbi:hypothetical protein [Frankia sp. Cj3]|uniref:hypothetical protein n=1 Tax=Frankia sp. Cj3 TaxID=2880976 RepID=UPI001EF51A30|nr:hypothetical protein [Frankia sp. Cj3]
MPTFHIDDRFRAEWARLRPDQQAAFHVARRRLLAALLAGERLDPRLGVKRFHRIPGAFELRWAADGRALWKYGDIIPGKPGPHIIWLSIGTHDIYKR